MKKLLIRVWRSIFPIWEYRWCAVTSAIGCDWEWSAYQCWIRNGEVDSRYAFLFVLPAPNKEEAIRIAEELNKSNA